MPRPGLQNRAAASDCTVFPPFKRALLTKFLATSCRLRLVCCHCRENDQATMCLEEVWEEATAVQMALAPMTDAQLSRLLDVGINGGKKCTWSRGLQHHFLDILGISCVSWTY